MANKFLEKCGATVPLGPFTPGKVRLKAIIWNACPFYKRLRQEIMLQYTSLTMQQVPAKKRENFENLPDVDGAFLRKKDNFYLGTYLAQFVDGGVGLDAIKSLENKAWDTSAGYSYGKFLLDAKSAAANENKNRNKNGPRVKASDAIPKFMKRESIEFLPDVGFSFLLARTNDPYLELQLEGYKATKQSALGGHQTFINIGSIYDNKTLPFQEYDLRERLFNSFDSVAMAFRAKWYYQQIKIGSAEFYKRLKDAQKTNVFVGNTGNSIWSFYAPALLGTELYTDPIDYMIANNISDTASSLYGPIQQGDTNVYVAEGVNPGLHWGLVKRWFVVPGQSYKLSFFKMAQNDYKSANSQNIYLMTKEFAWLDPYVGNKISNCAGFDRTNTYSQAKFDEAQKNQQTKYNLANQAYLLIKLQDDYTDNEYVGGLQELYLLICQNMAPTILRKFTWDIDCQQKAQSEQEAQSSQDSKCDTKNKNQVKNQEAQKTKQQKQIVTPRKYDRAYEVATCEFIAGSTLLAQPHLQITIRYCMGRLLISFSGAEDRTWVVSNTWSIPQISNSDVITAASGATEVANEYSMTSQTFPFQFTLSPIKIFGGNQKIAVNYTPCIFEPSGDITHSDLNIQGPADFSDVEVLLRDKRNEKQKQSTLSYNQGTRRSAPEFVTNYASEYKEKTKIDDDAVHYKIWPYHANQDAILLDNIKTSIGINASDCFVNLGNNTEYNKFIQANVNVTAGSIYLPNLDDLNDDFWLPSADTPVLNNMRVTVGSDGVAWNKQPIDVSNYVLSYSDQWSEENFKKLTHTGNISFYIQQSNDRSHNSITNTLLSLGDKVFYIQVSVWWEFNTRISDSSDEISSQSYLPDQEEDAIMFTGLCFGGSFKVENNKQVLSCTIEDYSKVLKDQKFYNSPFFDRMADIFAVKEILDMAGFRDGVIGGPDGFIRSTHAPGAFMREVCDSYAAHRNNSFYEFYFNGERTKLRNYVLPGKFDMLQSPKLKFGDDEEYWIAIDKIATMSSKVAYFDRLGVFKFENMPFDDYLFQIRNVNQSADDAERQALEAVLRIAGKNCFYASPKDAFPNAIKPPTSQQNSTLITDAVPPLQGPNIEKDNQVRNTPCTKSDVFSIATGLIIESYSFERIVSDIKNEIKIISNTPNGELLIAGDMNYESFYNPDSVGFVGYRKPWIQIDPIFASEITVKEMINHYTKFYIPPLKISFKVFGRNKLKALDAISFLGLGANSSQRQPLIITSLKNTVDASKNVWHQDIEALWLFSGKRVTFGTTTTYGIGLDGTVSSQ